MYRDIAKLVLYRDLGENSILMKLSGIFEDFDLKRCENAELCARIYDQIKRLLDLATSYGFDKNLWHNYLAFILITNENSFSITSEKVGANDGTVNYFAKNDFRIFKKLFDFDFSEIESALGIDCFSTINNYKSIGKKERMYNKNVSEKVQAVSNAIEEAENEDQIFDIVTSFYLAYVLPFCASASACWMGRARIQKIKRGTERMELTSNLLQFLVTLLGFCLAAILYHQNRRQAYFLLACFYGCFALGSLYWTLYPPLHYTAFLI